MDFLLGLYFSKRLGVFEEDMLEWRIKTFIEDRLPGSDED